MSEAALQAARLGLDAASALKIGQTAIDVAAFAQRTAGVTTVGARGEALRRITEILTVGAGAYAEKDIGGQSRIGGEVFGRVKL